MEDKRNKGLILQKGSCQQCGNTNFEMLVEKENESDLYIKCTKCNDYVLHIEYTNVSREAREIIISIEKL